MKLVPLTLAAILATTFCGVALAGQGGGGGNDNQGNSVSIGNHTFISNDMDVDGQAFVFGFIKIASESKAILDNSQLAIGNNGYFIGGDNKAKVDDHSGDHAQGNLGINVAAGSGNAQSNEVALSAIDARDVFAAAQTFSTQTSVVNRVFGLNADNNAKIDDSLNHVNGNVGVNVAAGSGNLQDNQLAASVNDRGTLAMATGSNQQTVAFNQVTDLNCNVDNNASVSNSLAWGQGNIGANVAAGYGNLQHNSLAIAVAQH